MSKRKGDGDYRYQFDLLCSLYCLYNNSKSNHLRLQAERETINTLLKLAVNTVKEIDVD